MSVELTPIEIRVLGSLVEKDRTTPDSYPLSTNALLAACNQKTSRDPVMALSAADVDTAMLELRRRELARTVKGAGERSYKHRHVFQQAMGLDDEQLAILSVLMLRGPQSPGELKTRTERYVPFPGTDEVERALGHLAARDEPLVRNVGRESGQSQDRWIHLLTDGDAPEPLAAEPVSVEQLGVEQRSVKQQSPMGNAAPSQAAAAPNSEVVLLRSEVAELRQLVEQLYEQLGMELSSADEAE